MEDEREEIQTLRLNCDSFRVFTQNPGQNIYVGKSLFAKGGSGTLFQCKPVPKEKFELTATTTEKKSTKERLAGSASETTKSIEVIHTKTAVVSRGAVIKEEPLEKPLKDSRKTSEENEKSKVQIYCYGLTVFTEKTKTVTEEIRSTDFNYA